MKLPLHWLFCLLLPGWLAAQNKKTTSSTVPAIVWDQSTLKKVAPFAGNHSANYARMIQLTNGSLLCVYESDGSIQCVTSKDLGTTWLLPVTIAAPEAGINMCVPEIIELKDHSLLASYNPRPYKINGAWDTASHFAICTKKSYDQGASWQQQRTLYRAGYNFEDGCWEPAQLQLPNGEVQLFFSNEGIYTTSGEQNISMFSSVDNGVTWAREPVIVSFIPHHRDGMPVPLLLQGTQQIVFSIEDNATGQFKPSIIKSSLQGQWQKTVGAKDTGRHNAFIPNLPDTEYAGAPYLRQLHSGQTILSYQSTGNRTGNSNLAGMQVAVGDGHAANFTVTNQPFTIPLDKHALWNALCILTDDTIIAITSTNAFTAGTSIWMIKGRLLYKGSQQ